MSFLFALKNIKGGPLSSTVQMPQNTTEDLKIFFVF